MENNTKKRYSINVAGIPLNLVTEESEEFLTKIAGTLSDEISAITSRSFCVSKMDAAILCALDALGESDKATAKARELEAELAVVRMDLENMREELDSLRDRTAPSKPVADNRTSDEKVRDLEKFLDKKFASLKDDN